MMDLFNGGRTDSGVRVSEMTALQVSTVYTCVNIISNAVAALPFNVFERITRGKHMAKRVAEEHALTDLFTSEPNPEMTIFTFFKTFMCHALLWGNAYVEIERDRRDASIKYLWPRNPARTRPVRLTQAIEMEGDVLPRGTLMFETSENIMGNEPVSGTDDPEMNWGTRRLVLAEDMIHVPGLSLDGRLGQNTTYLSRQVIGLALATEKYAAKFFGNGARPAGILTIPGRLEEKAIETLRRSWAEAHGGENQHKVAVLESGVTFQKIAATPDEGQMGNTRKYQREEIAVMFNVPTHMVGEASAGKSATSEQNSLEFIMYCLRPWLTAIEQEFGRKLFPSMGRTAGQYFPKFDTRMLVYPDAESRGRYYSSGRQWGYLTANDIRHLEDMNPTSDASGDTLMVQANMVNMKAMLLPLNPPTAPTPPATAPAPPGKPNTKPGQAPGLGKAAPKSGKVVGPKAGAKKKRGWLLVEIAEDGSLVPAESRGAGGLDFYIGRHGTTDDDIAGVWSGWDAVPLNAQGIEEITEAANALKAFGIRRIVSSDLPRCKQSVEIYSKILGVPVEYDERLRALKLGKFAKKDEKKYHDELQYYVEHPAEVIPGGESVDAYTDRVLEAYRECREENNEDGPTLFLTHSSGVAVIENEESELADAGVVMAPASVARIEDDGALTFIVGGPGTRSINIFKANRCVTCGGMLGRKGDTNRYRCKSCGQYS